jgi:hypothetical protein
MNKFIIIYLLVLLACFNTLSGQTDTTPPHITCKHYDFVYAGFNCQTMLSDTDFVDSLSDDQPAAKPLTLGIRKQCTGFGFPENKHTVSYAFPDDGKVEVWARDAAGNTATCTSTFWVADNTGSCDPGATFLYLETPGHDKISLAGIKIKGKNCLSDSISIHLKPDSNAPPGQFIVWGGASSPGYLTTLTPYKTGFPLNGVSTYDLVLVTAHILGVKPFTSPYQYIAADVNRDGKVTITDVVLLKKLILGISTDLPDGVSWRFIPQDYIFPDPANPIGGGFPERAVIQMSVDPIPWSFNFYGIKIGDLNNSADPTE